MLTRTMSPEGRITVTHLVVRPPWIQRLTNLLNLWRGAWRYYAARFLKIATFYGTLHATLLKCTCHAPELHPGAVCPQAKAIDYGLISTRSVTDEFVAHLVDTLGGTTTRISDYDHHASGTGTTAEAQTQTALVTDSGVARAAGTPSEPAANQYRSVGTQTYSSTLSITEHGLFSAASGTDELMDRSVFSAIAVVSGDSIQWTYTLTCTAGG